MLYASLPPMHFSDEIQEIMACPHVGAVRYNTGAATFMSPEEVVASLLALSQEFKKELWIDLKGRQLRIINWAFPNFGNIRLSHSVKVEGPALVYFRGSKGVPSKLIRAEGNVIYVDPEPHEAVGEGQAVNIVGEKVEVEGYLTPLDRQYIRAAAKAGVSKFMLSFVHGDADVTEVENEYKSGGNYFCPELALKIEDMAGYNFVRDPKRGPLAPNLRLVAARDDMFFHIGDNKARMLSFLSTIRIDSNAIVASRLFAGVEDTGSPTMADFSDVDLLITMGYQHFMLSDGICRNRFREAIEAWRQFCDAIGGFPADF